MVDSPEMPKEKPAQPEQHEVASRMLLESQMPTLMPPDVLRKNAEPVADMVLRGGDYSKLKGVFEDALKKGDGETPEGLISFVNHRLGQSNGNLTLKQLSEKD